MRKQLFTLETMGTLCDRVEVEETPEVRYQDHEPDNLRAILIDTAVQVGALIDGTCIDVRRKTRKKTLPVTTPTRVDRDIEMETVHLALTKNDRGLHAGGYIEMRVFSQERMIKANGGYYDDSRHARPVCEGALSLNELDHQKLGQILMLIHNRVMREYAECAARRGTRNMLTATPV